MKQINFIALLALAALLACNMRASMPAPLPEQAASADTHCRVVPRIATVGDHTRSSAAEATPPLRLAHLEPLIELIIRCGGELAVFSVTANANSLGGLVRFPVDPPAIRPVEPVRRNTPLLAFRRQTRDYQKAFDLWTEEDEARTEKARLRSDDFRRNADALLSRSRNDTQSDVKGALLRVEIFLNEETTWDVAIQPGLLIVSDLLETKAQGAASVYKLKSKPVTAVVHRSNQAGRFEGMPTGRFEAIEPAVTWLAARVGGGQ